MIDIITSRGSIVKIAVGARMTGEDVRIPDLRGANACGGRMTCVYLLQDRREKKKKAIYDGDEQKVEATKERTRLTMECRLTYQITRYAL